MKIISPSVELLYCTPFSAQRIEVAGRTCYKSENLIDEDSADRFVEMITKRGHESVIEHASASFRIVTDRGISHELVRHRLASYSQESTRYCNYSRDKFDQQITVIRPSGFLLGSEAETRWMAACGDAERAYFALLDAGAPPQNARSVLPTCLKTEIVMTANFREWCHFIKLRLSPEAHPDIRPLAYGVYQELRERCGPVFKRFDDKADAYVKACEV